MKRKRKPISSVANLSRGMVMVAAVLLAMFWLAPQGTATTRTVTILHTNNVTGHLFPCRT